MEKEPLMLVIMMTMMTTIDDVDDFQITTDDSSPDTNQRVDLRIKARDDN
jgi:hypothetical protein